MKRFDWDVWGHPLFCGVLIAILLTFMLVWNDQEAQGQARTAPRSLHGDQIERITAALESQAGSLKAIQRLLEKEARKK